MKKIIILVLVLVLIGGVGFYYYNNMKPKNNINIDAANIKSETLKSYTLADVSAHGVKTDCWLAIEGKVYDVTGFIASGKHNDKILNGCGKDATEMFKSIPKHFAGIATELMKGFVIGDLK